MKLPLPVVIMFTAVLNAHGDEPQIVLPFERGDWVVEAGEIDSRVLGVLHERGIQPANPCSDEVFVRRVYLDAIGTLPEPEAVRDFLADRDAGKRAALIEALLKRDEFADYWGLNWCDVLRVKAEFPIKLWPNAVQAYHRWVRDSIRANKPYDEFARELLTSSGSNFRVPPVNFYRAMQGNEPSTIAAAVAVTFMGVRFASLAESQRSDMSAFFSRVAFKGTSEWKEEIVYLDPTPADALEVAFPDGVVVRIPPTEDPRRVFADWLVAPDNPWFARSVVNRIWAWLMGRGIVHEPDDIRPDNPAVNPELLAYLAEELVAADYDLVHIYRLILNSRTYQQSSIPRSDDPDAEALFAHYGVRRLDAEVLIDALCWITDSQEGYSSLAPEPFTYIPEEHRTIALADGSTTSQFLEMFGRPSRDTGLASERNNEPSDAQRLHLLNSSDIQRRLERSPKLRKLMVDAKWNRREIARGVYLLILSREPTAAESAVAEEYSRTSGQRLNKSVVDVAWALINTKEFLFRH